METGHKNGTLRPLTKVEIDRRIGDLISEVVCPEAQTIRANEMETVGAPQWIAFAEFVKRMSPFLVYN